MRLKTIYFTLFTGLLAMVGAGCSDHVSDSMLSDGGLNLSLSEDCSVSTKATPSALGKPLASEFRISVRNSGTGTLAYDGPFCEKVNVRGGNYVIDAVYGEDVVLDLDSPLYMGQAEASVTAADPNPSVNIPCKVANALLSVCYLGKDGEESRELFDSFFSEYYVNVAMGNYSLNIRNPRQSAYMRAGTAPSSVTFHGVLSDNGRQVSFPIQGIPSSLEAAANLLLKLSLKESSSGVVLDVQKAEVEKVTVGETIPLEWLPAPVVSGFNGQSQMFYIETTEPSESAVLRFTTSHDLQDMELTFDFDNASAASINGTYVLSSLTDAQKQALSSYGLTMSEIGKTYKDGVIDLRGVISTLLTDNGEQVDSHINIRIKANNRWSDNHFIVSAVRPVFNMAEQIAGYAWAHSLYVTPLSASDIVDAKGADPQDLINAVKYEISADGGVSWTEIDSSDLGLAYVDGLESATQYLLRARIGNVMTSVTTAIATTEAETSVPNGDFESLSTTISGLKLNEGGKYTVKVLISADYQNTCTFTVAEPDGWASVNAKTCNQSASNQNAWYMVPSTYNSTLSWSSYNHFQKVTRGTPPVYENIPVQSGSNAMVVRNVAWDAQGESIAKTGGSWNTNYYCETKPNISQRSSGKLFLGSYSYSGNSETYIEGVNYGTRPSHLNGYYMYALDPDVADTAEKGTVKVSLLNGNNVIGTGYIELGEQSSYTHFSVPLTYTDCLLPATSLRIMITSSNYASYNQAEETIHIKTAYHLAGSTTTNNVPGETCSRGATLTIDNLTFTYDK